MWPTGRANAVGAAIRTQMLALRSAHSRLARIDESAGCALPSRPAHLLAMHELDTELAQRADLVHPVRGLTVLSQPLHTTDFRDARHVAFMPWPQAPTRPSSRRART